MSNHLITGAGIYYSMYTETEKEKEREGKRVGVKQQITASREEMVLYMRSKWIK